MRDIQCVNVYMFITCKSPGCVCGGGCMCVYVCVCVGMCVYVYVCVCVCVCVFKTVLL